MQFEEFDDDPPMFNIKHPKTTTGAAKKVGKDVTKRDIIIQKKTNKQGRLLQMSFFFAYS